MYKLFQSINFTRFVSTSIKSDISRTMVLGLVFAAVFGIVFQPSLACNATVPSNGTIPTNMTSTMAPSNVTAVSNMTTAGSAPAVTVAPTKTNNGKIKIKMVSQATPCRTYYRNPTWLQFASPSFPSFYDNNQFCNMTLITDEPRYMLIKVEWIDIHSSDVLNIGTAFGKTFRVTNAHRKRLLLTPTSWAEFTFTSDSSNTANGYLLEMVQLNNDCHQVINLTANGGGKLSMPSSPYNQYTVCEWWIIAEPGSKVELKLLTFEMGDASSTCPKDYLGVDKSGDPAYNTDSSKYCGSTNPGTIVSNGNRLNVLAFGWYGGKPGFTAEYRAV